MAEWGEQDPVIIEENPPDEWQDIGSQNPAEAHYYCDKVDAIFEGLSDMLNDDCKDALLKMIQNFKKLAAKHWLQMVDVDVNTAIKMICDPSCLHLRQSLVTGAPKVVESSTEVPEGWKFLYSLPKKKHKEEERQMIITLFDHVSEAHAHMSWAAACVSLLGKIMDPHTFDAVVKTVACTMVQINIPERYLSPVQDPRPMTTTDQQQEKISKMLLLRLDAACLSWEPKNSPTWLLVVVVLLRLKRKYMNSSMAIDACKMFNISVKTLSKVLLGKKYAGGSE